MKPVSIVVLGLNFGRSITRNLYQDVSRGHVRLHGVCDLDRSKAETIAAECGGLRIYSDLEEVLADPEIEAVGLFTGPDGRASLISKIINAGKDVMTTKPFEIDVEAARTVLNEARQLERIIHLNSPNPGTTPDLQQILIWQNELSLGNPVAARAEVWVKYREQADGSWYDDQEKCPVAPVFRLGIYLINDLVRVFGRARRVNVLSTRCFTGRPTADNAVLGIEFESGAMANVFASFCVGDGDHYRNGLTVNFENGTVYREVGPERGDSGALLSVVVHDPELDPPRRVAARKTVDFRSGQYDWVGFAAAVRGEYAAPEYEIDHIVEPLGIISAMAESERFGRTVEVRHA